MSQNLSPEELLDQIDVTPFGPQERELMDQAVALALETGDETFEYQVRMRLTASAMNAGDTDAMLASFAWCLGKHSQDPTRFPIDVDNGGADLLWQYKWMAGALNGSPIFPRGEIDAVLEDMQLQYSRAGVGMSAVMMSRFETEWHAGRLEDAERLRKELAATEEDDYSHCDACVRSQMAGFLAETGREAESLTLVGELVEGGFSCGDEPEFALSRSLLPLLRAGRFDEARDAHLRSYRLARGSRDKIEIVAGSLVFCAVTGNEARGLAMLERHLGWLAHDGLNVSGHFTALVAVAVLLDSVTRAGHGDSPVRGADDDELVQFFGLHEGQWRVDDLAGAAWAAATAIGSAFDARNGNEYFAGRVDAAKALAGERYDVPVSTDTFAPTPTHAPAPQTPAEWARRATALAWTGQASDADEAARRALTGTDGQPGVEGGDRADMLSLLIGTLVHQDKLDEAAALLPERREALVAAGRPEQADLESRVGLALFGKRDELAQLALEAELETLPGLDVPSDVLGDVQLSLAMLYAAVGTFLDDVDALVAASVLAFDKPGFERHLHAALMFQASRVGEKGDTDAAFAAVARSLELDSNDAGRAEALLYRAQLHGSLGDIDSAIRDSEEAVRLFTALDLRHALIRAAAVSGALLADASRFDESLSRYRFALRTAELQEQQVTGLRFAVGNALLRAGHPADAAEVLQEVYDEETKDGATPGARGETLFVLAHAHQQDEEFGYAVDAWLTSASLLAEGDDGSGAARALISAASLLRRFQEFDDAADALTEAVEHARAADAAGLLVEGLHALGTVRAESGHASAIDALEEAIALADEHGADWTVADITDSKARALESLGRTDEAIPLALAAADAYADAGDPTSAGGSELFVARVLTAADRPLDAVPIFRSALDRATESAPLRSLVALELGDVLESLGRTAEAAEARGLADEV